MQKLTIFLTDSNTYNQIRPKSANKDYERLSGTEVKELFEIIKALEENGLATVENKIKRDGYTYGLYKLTGEWYPAVEKSSEAIVDVPYGDMAVNLSLANPTQGLDVNNRDNWDKGQFDLEARVVVVNKPEDGVDWKRHLFKGLLDQIL